MDKVILDGVEYVIKEIRGNDVLLVKRDNALNIVLMNEKTLCAKLYEQQKQRADELEDRISEEIRKRFQLEDRWRKAYERADELAELYAQSEKESESLSISLCEMIEKNHERTTKLIQEKSKAVERADELEKRWSELVDVLKKKYDYYKVRADDESAGPIGQGKWKIAKHEVLMALMTMAELQEDDNA